MGRNTFSGVLQAYGSLAGDTSPVLRVDEAYGTISTATGWNFTGGIQRYPGQYSTYWNPTFPIRPKMDLSRPDYFAPGVPLLSVSRSLGAFTPRLMAIWRDGESYGGAQLDMYARTVEAYVNGFWSKDSERMLGVGIRTTVRGWTVQARPVHFGTAEDSRRMPIARATAALRWCSCARGLRNGAVC